MQTRHCYSQLIDVFNQRSPFKVGGAENNTLTDPFGRDSSVGTFLESYFPGYLHQQLVCLDGWEKLSRKGDSNNNKRKPLWSQWVARLKLSELVFSAALILLEQAAIFRENIPFFHSNVVRHSSHEYYLIALTQADKYTNCWCWCKGDKRFTFLFSKFSALHGAKHVK